MIMSELRSVVNLSSYGKVSIHLKELIEEKGITRYRLAKLAGGLCNIDISTVLAKADRVEAGAYLLRTSDKSSAEKLDLLDSYNEISCKTTHQLGSVERENIEKLYGKSLFLSASQVDKQANCRLSYFLRYGLNAKERKTITIDPAEFGTYVHAVLEETAKEIMDLGGFRNVTLEQTKEIAKKHSDTYAEIRFSQLDSQRVRYLFNRNADEL